MQLQNISAFLLACLLASPSQARPQVVDGEGIQRGASIYAAYCAACHGDDGGGDGAMAGQLPPDSHPADLTTWIFQGSRTDEDIRRAIRDGGTSVHKSDSMPAWSQALTYSQVGDLVAFIRGLRKSFAPDLISAEPLDDELKVGKVLYSIRCLPCHGVTGEGRGFLLESLVSSGTAPLETLMPDFSLYPTIEGKDDAYFEAVISSGISHSGLALQTSNGWWNRTLELPELRALILYLRTLPKG